MLELEGVRRLAAATGARKLAIWCSQCDQVAMRFIPILALALLAAACARTPQPTATPAPLPVTRHSDDLNGLTAAELIARFGQPGLQVREGVGTKLQWANASCVLDAYLYPGTGGRGDRVTHVDARRPSGDDLDARACIAALGR